MERFDRWCHRHNKYGIKNLMLYIIIGNAICFVLANTTNGAQFVYNWLPFVPSAILRGEVWRIVTFVFISQSDNLFVLLLSSLFYYFVGSMLENTWGRMKMSVFYLTGVLLHIVVGFALHFSGNPMQFVGSEYLNLSLFLAYAALNPNDMLRIYLVLPVKVKWLAIVDLALIGWGVVSNSFPYNIAPLVVLLNCVIFLLPLLLRHSKRRTFETRNRINFQQKSKELKKRGYLHRCSVCGKTDTSHPDMEFRYCSRCRNYACYCEEHILDHTHID